MASRGPPTPRLPVGSLTPEALTPSPGSVISPDLPRSRRILGIAWPVIVANFLQTLALTVDLIFVGSLGTDPLASAGLASQVYLLMTALATGVATGATAIVSRSFGAGRPDQAWRDAWIVVLVSLAIGIPSALLLVVLAPQLIVISGGTGVGVGVTGASAHFLAILSFGLPATFFITSITGAFQGAGDTRPTLTNGLIINAVNIVFDWLLIFGNLGAPRLGLYGAATATAIAYTVGAILFLVVLLRGRRPIRLTIHRPTMERVRTLVRVGTPAGIEQFMLTLGFTAYLFLILRFGASALAAHQVGLRVQSFAFTPGFGFSTAAAALVGQAIGAGDPARAEADAWGAMRMALMLMIGGSIPLMLAAPYVARLFIDPAQDPVAFALGTTWIRTLVLAIPAIAIHFTAAGALRGAGDTRWPLYVSFFGLWLVRLPLAWYLSTPLGYGMLGIWAAYVIEYYARATVTTLRFRSGRWKKLRL
ncbi:MAG: MATE family efflux transporter [Thermoplasmatota archaeon]